MVTKPNRPLHLTIPDFIIQYLELHRSAYVHEMLNAYNAGHYSNKPAKYTSFRTIVWNLHRSKHIKPVPTPANSEDRGGFPKSYYARTALPYAPPARGRPTND